MQPALYHASSLYQPTVPKPASAAAGGSVAPSKADSAAVRSSQAEALPAAVATAQGAAAANLPQAEQSHQSGPHKAAATGQTVRDQVKRNGGGLERGIPAHGTTARDKSQESRVDVDTAAKADASQPAAAQAETEPAAATHEDKSAAAIAVDTHTNLRVRTSGGNFAGSDESPRAAAGASQTPTGVSQTPTGLTMPSASKATAAAPDDDDDDEVDNTGSDSAAAPLTGLKHLSSSQQSAAAAKAFGLADTTQPEYTPVMPARNQPKSALAGTAGNPSSSPTPHSQLTGPASTAWNPSSSSNHHSLAVRTGAMLHPHGDPGRHTAPAGVMPQAAAASSLHKGEAPHALVLPDAVPSPQRASAAAVLATPLGSKPGTPQPYTADPIFEGDGRLQSIPGPIQGLPSTMSHGMVETPHDVDITCFLSLVKVWLQYKYTQGLHTGQGRLCTCH